MVVAKVLIRNALQSVQQHTNYALYVVTTEIIELLCHVRAGTFKLYLEESGIRLPKRLSLFSSPDLIWNAICQKHPNIYVYPLGEITERSFKSTVGYTISAYASDSRLHKLHSKKSLLEKLQMALLTTDSDENITTFLTNWFFNLAVSNLRSIRGWMKADFGFAYHFSRQGQFVSFATHISLRDKLYKVCNDIALEFLPYLIQSYKYDEYSKFSDKLAKGWQQTLGIHSPKPDSLSRNKKPPINVVVGAMSRTKLQLSFDVADTVTHIVPYGKNKNVRFDLEPIESFIGRRIHTLVRDLFEIGFAVYMADIYVQRQPNLERQLSLLIPVRHVEKWTQVQTELERAISLLGRDRVNVHFTKRKEACDKVTGFEQLQDGNGFCCLLSGGLDSAAGAMWAIEKEYAPILVSHSPGPALSNVQKCVVESITQEYQRDLHHIIVPWTKSKRRTGRFRLGNPPYSPMYQHLRSFFYLCLATGIAIETKCNRVYVFENGPVAINPLLSEAHINTRTVHPIFIEEFRSLIKAVFGIEMELENPFLYKTKGEVANTPTNRESAQRVLRNTNSCLNYARIPANAKQWFSILDYPGRHDGVCLPCILRRVAMYRAKIPEGDGDYLVNIFDLFGSDMHIRFPERTRGIFVSMADLIRFCQYVLNLNDCGLLSKFPDVSVSANGIDSRKTVAMLRRHSREITQCFKKKSTNGTKIIFHSAL